MSFVWEEGQRENSEKKQKGKEGGLCRRMIIALFRVSFDAFQAFQAFPDHRPLTLTDARTSQLGVDLSNGTAVDEKQPPAEDGSGID